MRPRLRHSVVDPLIIQNHGRLFPYGALFVIVASLYSLLLVLYSILTICLDGYFHLYITLTCKYYYTYAYDYYNNLSI